MSNEAPQLNGIDGKVLILEGRVQVLESRQTATENTVFGSRENPREQPGLVVEQVKMSLVQERTNEILTEFRDDVKKAFIWLFSLMATAICATIFSLIFKGVSSDAVAAHQPVQMQTTTTTTQHAP